MNGNYTLIPPLEERDRMSGMNRSDTRSGIMRGSHGTDNNNLYSRAVFHI